MDKKQTIQLTEQDLHMLVEDAVRTYLVNEGMEEGIWGGMKNLGQKASKAVGSGLNKMGSAIGTAATNAYNNVTGATSNAYNQAKTAYQQGSAQQDLQNINSSLKKLVGKGAMTQGQYNEIRQWLNAAIRQNGGQNMQGIA